MKDTNPQPPEEAVAATEATDTPDTVATTEATEPAEATEATKRPGIPLVYWVITVLLALLAGLGGYVLGTNHGEEKALASVESAMNSDDPQNPNAPARSEQEDQKLAKKAKPGKGDKQAKAQADGTYNAQIHGPGAPIKSADDVLNVHRRDAEDPFAIGAVDAPVVISEFSDFECPFCARWANATEPTIMKNYVDKGLVRLEWNDMPVNGENAVAGAKAGRAAAEQGKFFEFKKALYTASKDKTGHPNYGFDDFVRFAEEAGVPDMEKFKADAQSDKYDQTLDESRAYAAGIGISGTPGFFIGKTYVAGAQATDMFEKVITQELARVGAGEVEVPKK